MQAILSYILSVVHFVPEWLDQVMLLNQDFMLAWVTAHHKRRNTIQLVQLFMCRSFYLHHNFVVAIKILMHHNLMLQIPMRFLWTRLLPKTKGKKRYLQIYHFQLAHRSSLMGSILHQRVKDLNTACQHKRNSSMPLNQMHLGGYRNRAFRFEVLEPYVTSNILKIDTHANFKYIDHVSDVQILKLEYPSDRFVHTSMPLNLLCEILPATKARKIAVIHGISAGSRCTPSQLVASVVNHSCHSLACSNYSTIFEPAKNEAQLAVDRVTKSRKNQVADIKLDKNEGCTQNQMINTVFPPHIPEDLVHTIASSACKKMDKANIEEAGCAVCGELKQLKQLSHVKNIKNMLHILSTPGVTCIENKIQNSKVHEYSGPVLDYSCNHVCDQCHSCIFHNGKIPHLALANNLWLGKVPEELNPSDLLKNS